MNLSLDLSMKLQQKLSFQMIQSLKLLQVNTLQLEQMLKAELEVNPVLDMVEESDDNQVQEEQASDSAEEQRDEEKELDLNEDTVDWEEYLEEGYELNDSRTNDEIDYGKEHYEATPVYQPSLEEYLSNQLTDRTLPEETVLRVQLLIGHLDSDGYLRTPIEAIAEFASVPVQQIEEALEIVWTLEPPGIGARTLQECLALQLRRLNQEQSLSMRIVREAWDHFEKLRLPDIARQFGVDLREVQEAINLIKRLHPKPGYLVVEENSTTIIPDLIVEKIDEKFVVMLNDRSIPSLHINRAYANLIKRGSRASTTEKKYIREKLNSASWLIRSIEQRKSTMINVMYAIIERQKEFFEKGPAHLRPLKLQDVADIVSMHISTISRVTSNKYVQTVYGIFELKYFFTEAVGAGSDGDSGDVSSERIKNRIREMVANENPLKPLSDQKIADILSREEMAVARRTVAKYREQLRILPARMRQKYE